MYASNHSSTVDVEPGLPFVDLTGFDVTLASHGPNRWKQCHSLWNLCLVNDGEVTVIQLCLDFFDHRPKKLFAIWFMHGLVEVHDVRIVR